MYPASDEFFASLRKSHTVFARAEVFRRNTQLADLPIISGSVTIDKTANFRRRVTLDIEASSVELPGPDFDNSPLWPVGYEIKVWSGQVFPLNYQRREEVPMGVFRISRPKISRTPEGISLSVEGFDRSRAVSHNRFTQYYIIEKGSNYGVVLKQLIQDRAPFLDVDQFVGFDQITNTCPALILTPEDDPWIKALEMARSCGFELMFNVDGNPEVKPNVDPASSAATFTYASGNEAMLSSIDRDLDDEESFNGVIVVGRSNDHTEKVPRGEAWDTDPTSPTYYDPNSPRQSLYGGKPKILTSDLVTDDEQALTMSRSELLLVSGVLENIQFSGICNPAHDASDIIKIEDNPSGVNNLYQLESVQIGLGYSGNMSGTTRKRRIAA